MADAETDDDVLLDDNGEPLEVLVLERANHDPFVCEAMGHHKGMDIASCEGYIVSCEDFTSGDGEYRCKGERVRAA